MSHIHRPGPYPVGHLWRAAARSPAIDRERLPQRLAGSKDVPGLPRGRAEQTQQPSDRGDQQIRRPGSSRKSNSPPKWVWTGSLPNTTNSFSSWMRPQSTNESMDSIVSSGDFEFGDISVGRRSTEETTGHPTRSKMPGGQAFCTRCCLMRSTCAHPIAFRAYEHSYRVRFRIDGELREIASPDCHQGQAGIAHQGDIAPGHFGKARAPDGRMKLKSRSGPGHRFSRQKHAAHPVWRKNRDPYPGSEQCQTGYRRTGL